MCALAEFTGLCTSVWTSDLGEAGGGGAGDNKRLSEFQEWVGWAPVVKGRKLSNKKNIYMEF